jgi:hypothetical protein
MSEPEVIKLKEIAPADPYANMSSLAIGLRTLVESIPLGLGPYGIGDFITLYEGISGRMVMGPRLDFLNRIISILAALIPIVPATPFRIFAIKTRQRLSRS